MKCPCCGGADLIHATRDLPYTYQGHATLLAGITGDFCAACDEVILDREQGDRYISLIKDFQGQIDSPE